MTNPGPMQKVSRRFFLRSAAGSAFAHLAANSIPAQIPRMRTAKPRAYVGTYTGAVGNLGNGEGIYLFDVNEVTGELTNGRLAAASRNPSWIAFHPSRTFLYAVNEVADYEGNSGSVSAFAVNPRSGELRALNTVNSAGAGPAYLSLDRTGKFAFVANYGSGSIAVLPLHADGSLGAAVDVHRDIGSTGSLRATDAPAGSFAISGHDAPHAHMIAPDPQNRFVLATDLGQDRIYSYRFDAATGKLTANSMRPFTAMPTGDGPRHFVFHPNRRWLYSIQEEASTIAFFQYDTATGLLSPRQTVSALPPGFAGTSFASEILIAPDGRFLYGANRLHDTIAAFAIAADGMLTPAGEASTMGDYPSQFSIEPGGRFLYACNRRSDSITSFRLHPQAGIPVFTGKYTGVGSPAWIGILS